MIYYPPQQNGTEPFSLPGLPQVLFSENRHGDAVLQVVKSTDAPTLQRFVESRARDMATVYTDAARSYAGLSRPHEVVKPSAGEYVRAMAHTNGVESFWSMLKRGYIGIYHHFSSKHLHRYVCEFEGRHNQRPLDTLEQMVMMARGMVGKRLRYADRIA